MDRKALNHQAHKALGAGTERLIDGHLRQRDLALGIVLGQAGRLVLAADGSQLSFNGNSVDDVEGLCAALAP